MYHTSAALDPAPSCGAVVPRVHLAVNNNPREALLCMARADVLVTSFSSLGWVAALLHEGARHDTSPSAPLVSRRNAGSTCSDVLQRRPDQEAHTSDILVPSEGFRDSVFNSSLEIAHIFHVISAVQTLGRILPSLAQHGLWANFVSHQAFRRTRQAKSGQAQQDLASIGQHRAKFGHDRTNFGQTRRDSGQIAALVWPTRLPRHEDVHRSSRGHIL